MADLHQTRGCKVHCWGGIIIYCFADAGGALQMWMGEMSGTWQMYEFIKSKFKISYILVIYSRPCPSGRMLALYTIAQSSIPCRFISKT